jgi:hypothetical protein
MKLIIIFLFIQLSIYVEEGRAGQSALKVITSLPLISAFAVNFFTLGLPLRFVWQITAPVRLVIIKFGVCRKQKRKIRIICSIITPNVCIRIELSALLHRNIVYFKIGQYHAVGPWRVDSCYLRTDWYEWIVYVSILFNPSNTC